MNPLSLDKKIRVVSALVDGCSIRATERLCGVHRDTVMHLGVTLGEACQRLHDALMTAVHVDLLQVDEIWAFIYKKQKRLCSDDPPEQGDEYTYVGLDAVNKAIVAFRVGKRTGETTNAFAQDLRHRISNRPQITSDGFQPYIDAIKRAFGCDVDYAMVVKQYGGRPQRYQGSERTTIAGTPRLDKMSTSMVERENLTMRMGLRRFTRKTNGFSKKLRHHVAAVALYVVHYNFCRIHATLRSTPAMAMGVAEQPWSIAEMIDAALSISDPSVLAKAPALRQESPVPALLLQKAASHVEDASSGQPDHRELAAPANQPTPVIVPAQCDVPWTVYMGVNHTKREVFFGATRDLVGRGTMRTEGERDDVRFYPRGGYAVQEAALAAAHEKEQSYVDSRGYKVIKTIESRPSQAADHLLPG